MDRRSVLKFGLVGTAGIIVAPQNALAAAEPGALVSSMAGGLYYTKQKSGRWAKKADGHVPQIEHEAGKLRILTPHPMDGFKHYIVKHVILDEKFQYISETLFDPAKDSPQSEYDTGRLKGVVYAVSMCNLHDVWLSAIRI